MVEFSDQLVTLLLVAAILLVCMRIYHSVYEQLEKIRQKKRSSGEAPKTVVKRKGNVGKSDDGLACPD
jgi:hypothetical protein